MTQSEATINEAGRRPIRSRGWVVFDAAAHALVRWGVSPNAVSVGSVVFAVAGACLMVVSVYIELGVLPRVMLFAAALSVQGRLVCNLLDGMVAERGPGGTLVGRLYNEVPDRVSDVVLFVGFGWLVARPEDVALGALAACMAVLTAYVRAMAGEVGAPPPFCGPMAKPQRMALLTAALVALALEPWRWLHAWWGPDGSWGLVESVLWVCIVGCAWTAWRRLMRIARYAKAGGAGDDDA